MKIKIIKNIPLTSFGQSIGSIESLIGNVYNVTEQLENERIMIYVPEWKGLCSIYKGEYEIIQNMDLVNSYKEGLSLNRINNDLPYSKSNCRWITMLEQQSNKRNNVLITYNNETKTLTQFAQEYGIRYDTLKWRLKHGWSIEKALNTKITQKEV